MEIRISTKNEKDEKVSATVKYDMPSTLADLVKKFGEGPVTEAAISSFVIGIQNTGRRLLVASKDKTGKVIREAQNEAQIQAAINDWAPDTKAVVRLSPLERATKSLDNMSEADRKALLARIQELQKAQANQSKAAA